MWIGFPDREFYLLINCFPGQFEEILTKVCKICTSAARAILSKLRSIFSRIWPEKQLISRLVPALWETLKLLNRYVNFVDLITVMTSFAVNSATKWPVTWLLSPNHWLTSPRAIRTAGTNDDKIIQDIAAHFSPQWIGFTWWYCSCYSDGSVTRVLYL